MQIHLVPFKIWLIVLALIPFATCDGFVLQIEVHEDRFQTTLPTEDKLNSFRKLLLSEPNLNFPGIISSDVVQSELALTEEQAELIKSELGNLQQTIRDLRKQNDSIATDPLGNPVGVVSVEEERRLKESKQLERDSILSSRQTVVDLLHDAQQQRLFELIFQIRVARKKLFGEYRLDEMGGTLLNWDSALNWDTAEQLRINEKALELRGKYEIELNRIWNEFHQRLRQKVGEETQNSLEELLGPPPPVAYRAFVEPLRDGVTQQKVSPTNREVDGTDFLSVEFYDDPSDARINLFSFFRQQLILDELAINNEQQMEFTVLQKSLWEEIQSEANRTRPPLIDSDTLNAMSEEDRKQRTANRAQQLKRITDPIIKSHHEKAIALLLPVQRLRLKQLTASRYLNRQKLFAEYENPKLKEFIDFQDNEFDKLADSVPDVRKHFMKEVNEIHANYHEEIRDALDEESRKQLVELAGEPIELMEDVIVTRR